MTTYTITVTQLGDDGQVIGGSPQNITVTDGSGAGGAGAVVSVNGQTGVVTLDAADVGAATTAQGALADTAVQPATLADVATSGDYDDLTNTPTLGTAAEAATTDFDAAGAAATAQSAAVATSEAYTDAQIAALPDPGSGTVTSVNTVEPVDGDVTLTPADIGAATSAQGALADTATQPEDLATVATTGAYTDLTGTPTIPDSPDDIGAVPTTRTVAGHALSADVTISASDVGAAASSHTHAESDVTNLTTDLAGKVPTSRTVSAGTGLTGGGDLSANRTLAADFGTGAGKVTQGNDSRLSDARTPTAHASTHGSGQSDAVALDASQVTRTTNAQTGTTYTLVLADASKFVSLSNASAITLTVPPNSSVAFPVGTEIILAQLGAGQVTIAPGSGVTLNSTPGLKIAAQYGTAALKKTATDTWLVFGRLAA